MQKGQRPCSGHSGCSGRSEHSRCWCKKVNSHSVLSKYWWWGTVTFSANRSIHTVYSANMGGGGLLPLVQKGQPPCSGHSGRIILVQKGQFTQCTQQISVVGTITFGAKRSTPQSSGHSGRSECSRCWCKKVNSHSVLSKYGCRGSLPLAQKGQPMQSTQ